MDAIRKSEYTAYSFRIFRNVNCSKINAKSVQNYDRFYPACAVCIGIKCKNLRSTRGCSAREAWFYRLHNDHRRILNISVSAKDLLVCSWPFISAFNAKIINTRMWPLICMTCKDMWRIFDSILPLIDSLWNRSRAFGLHSRYSHTSQRNSLKQSIIRSRSPRTPVLRAFRIQRVKYRLTFRRIHLTFSFSTDKKKKDFGFWLMSFFCVFFLFVPSLFSYLHVHDKSKRRNGVANEKMIPLANSS